MTKPDQITYLCKGQFGRPHLMITKVFGFQKLSVEGQHFDLLLCCLSNTQKLQPGRQYLVSVFTIVTEEPTKSSAKTTQLKCDHVFKT